MASIKVIDLITEEVLNTINAELTDECPEGYYFKLVEPIIPLPVPAAVL